MSYHRVARKDQQDTGPSQGGQLARCLAYIKASGWANVAEYTDGPEGDSE